MKLRKKSEKKIHRPWLQQLHQQTKDGMEAVDNMCMTPWINREQMTQADVSAVVFLDAIKQARLDDVPILKCPKLFALSKRANSLSAFSDTFKVRGH